MKFFFLSQKDIVKLKYEKNKNNMKYVMTIKFLIIKYICFFTSILLLSIFFWYYLSCFCSLYKNSQIYLFKIAIISFSFSLIYGFIIFLIPGIFRIAALKNPRKFCFKISLIIQYMI